MKGRTFFIQAGIFLVVFSSGEFYLRHFWSDPYTFFHPEENVYLLPAGITLSVNTSNLFPDGGMVRVRTDFDHSIMDGRAPNKKCLAIGGSTTFNGSISENDRWPGRVDPPALNYGLSSATSTNDYENLKYLTSTVHPETRCIYLMTGANDARQIEQPTPYSVLPPINPLQGELASLNQLPLVPFSLGDLRWARFILHLWDGLVGWPAYRYLEYTKAGFDDSVRISKDIEAPRREYSEKLREPYFQYLKNRFAQFMRLSEERNLQIYWITQPHGYLSHSVPFKKDLRKGGTWRTKPISLESSAYIMEALNGQIRSLGLGEKRVVLLDGEKCFDSVPKDQSLFFDGIHFTPLGNRVFAECLTRLLHEDMSNASSNPD